MFFLGLGANSIWDANEAFYVETPRQMVLAGDYVSPTFGGEPRFNKPVLSYWLVAGAYRLVGESVATERLVIAFGAMGILLATFFIGSAIGTRATGVLSALLLATAPRFVFFSRRIMIDIYITMFMALSLAFFVLAERHPQHRRRLLFLMYVAIGCGVLTKGPVALVLPALALGFWLVTERRLEDIRRLWLLPGALVILAIVVPWYAAIYSAHGWTHIRQFFIDENLGRLASPLTTSRSPFFFLPVLLGDILLPWAPLIAVPMIGAWRRTTGSDASAATRRLLWWWVVVIVAAFSLSASKEDLYILPAIPAAAALVAGVLTEHGWGATNRAIRTMLAVIGVLCMGLAGVIAWEFTDGYYALAGAYVLASVLAVAGAASGLALWRGRFQVAVMSLAAGFVVFNYVFVLRVLPDLERMKPVPPLATVINERGRPDAALAFFNMDLPSFVYYTRRPVTKIGSVDEATAFFATHGEAWMVSSQSEWESLQSRVPGLCLAARRPLFAAKAADILRRQPPPDVLLLTTGRGCAQ